MKRTLVALLLVAALAAPAFGQDVGAPWIDSGLPFAAAYDGTTASPTFAVALPTSILAFISNGIYADEIDMVVRNPAALSQFSGYTLWTLYGNYEAFNNAATLNTPQAITGAEVQPFNTTTLNDANIGNFQAGIGMPVPFMDGWRMGLLGGRQFTRANGLTGGYSTYDTSDKPTLTTVDADADGTADATTTSSIVAKDETTTGSFRMAAGLDMGFLGVSLYAFAEDRKQVAGGSYNYAWTDGADDDVWAGVNTANSSLYGVAAFGTDAQGTEAAGVAKNWNNGSRSLFGAVGQLPFELFGFKAPITARVGFDTFSGSYSDTAMPTRWTATTRYVVNNDAAKVSTQSWTGSTDISAAWLPATPGAYVEEPARITDPTNSGYGYFGTSIGAWIDPVIEAEGSLTLKPRLGMNYAMGIQNANVTSKAYSYSSIATANATNDLWTFSDTRAAVETDSANILSFDLGALGEFANAEDTIGLGVGLYAKPLIKLSGASYKPRVTTTIRSWIDQNNTNEVTLAAAQGAGSLPAAAALISMTGGVEGRSELTTTRTYSQNAIENEFGITMSLPVSAKISFFDKKLTLVGGYVIDFANTVTYTRSAVSTDVTTLVITDSAGNPVFNSGSATDYPAGQSVAATTNASTEAWDVGTNQLWTGTMGFMFRWTPNETMTVDMTGTSVKAAFGALDGLFSLGGGIMPSQLWDFVDALALSVTFHF